MRTILGSEDTRKRIYTYKFIPIIIISDRSGTTLHNMHVYRFREVFSSDNVMRRLAKRKPRTPSFNQYHPESKL